LVITGQSLRHLHKFTSEKKVTIVDTKDWYVEGFGQKDKV